VDPQTNLLSVRIVVANPNGMLKAGEFATARIVVRMDPRAVVVPKQAVVTQEQKQVVFTVKDGVAHRREVATGVEEGDLVEITRGLSAGEKVIRLGQYELSDGAKVKPAAAPESKPEGGDKE
jgi:membrane fusion protein (multidrug efflux system)